MTRELIERSGNLRASQYKRIEQEVVARRKRRRCTTMSILATSVHAFLVLLATCGGSNHLIEALVAPAFLPGRHSNMISSQQQHTVGRYEFHTSRAHDIISTTRISMSTSVVDDSTTEMKGQSSPTQSQPSKQLKRRKKKSTQRKSNKTKRRVHRPNSSPSPSSPNNKPWNADYTTSLRTQKRIQSAAYNSKGSNTSSIQIANSVLTTLLSAPPAECNAANIVCALTLSSKTLSRGRRRATGSEEMKTYQMLLTQTLQILHQLVSQNKLSPRQLCNAAWSIAKHVEYDPTLFSRERDGYVALSTTWDLREKQLNEEESTYTLIDNILNLIAVNMIQHLDDIRLDTGDYGKDKRSHRNKRRVQSGELSMLLWSYAVVKPRDCPPGWEMPRRMERLASSSENESGDDMEDVVTFVQLDDAASSISSIKSSEIEQPSTTKPKYKSITSRLFDTAAIAFCQGEGAAVVKQPSPKDGNDGEANGMTLLKACTWSELSNIAWSYATRGAYGTLQGEAMMSFFAKEATRRVRYCISTSAGSGGSESNGQQQDDVCNILPRDVIQIAWALGTMESDNVSVGETLIHLVDVIDYYWIAGKEEGMPLARWTCADLVQMATALAHGRLDNQSVLAAVYEESLTRLISNGEGGRGRSKNRGFSTAEISILLWVQARLYLTPKFGDVYEAFPSAASRALLQRMEQGGNQNLEDNLYSATRMHQIGLGSQEQANLAWSLTVLEDYDESAVTLLQNIFHAASSNDEGIIQLEHAHQLWQSYFLLSKDCPPAVQYVPDEFSQYLEEKWNIEKSRSKTSSSRHKAISQTLDLMRVAHRNEYDEDVDVAIVLTEDSAWTREAKSNFDVNRVEEGHHKVAMEFDGPHHFTVMASNGDDLAFIENGGKIKPRVLGHTVLKYRLLKKKGWTVVRIPYYEFDKIPFWASMERQRYLQRALKTHESISFSEVDVSEYKAMPSTRHSRFD